MSTGWRTAQPGVVDKGEVPLVGSAFGPFRTLVGVSLHLFDTATREQRAFSPVRAGAASIYVCGATVQCAITT